MIEKFESLAKVRCMALVWPAADIRVAPAARMQDGKV
jgi:hypothetical protein